MNTNVVNAVERLNKILPLVQRKKNLSSGLADVYQNILHSYVERGRTLNRDEIAQQVANVDECINTLNDNDMVVFDSNGGPKTLKTTKYLTCMTPLILPQLFLYR